MSTTKLVASVATQWLASRVATALGELVDPAPDAVTMFEEGSGARVEAYYDQPVDPNVLRARLTELLGDPAPDLAIEPVPAENWVVISQAALPPVRAGRFVVHGSHDRGRIPLGPGAILIDAGAAFGTAHHATTAGCLLAIDRATRRRRFRSVLDLGCGTGVLAIAARRALAGSGTRIIATDIDPDAVRVARENVRANREGLRIDVLLADGLSHPRLRSAAGFDLVVANILAGPLAMLAKDVRRITAPRGVLVLSGILLGQAAAVVAAYRAQGFTLLRFDRRAEWATLALVRRPACAASAKRAA
ncbi:MAG: 50S ribosomal protein L11 methyltransferase [Pseudomonadota bacterium]